MSQQLQQSINTVMTITPNPAIDFMVTASDWQRGEVNKGQNSYTKAGGKGINVATALSELQVQEEHGVQILASGWLGQANETVFVEHLKNHNILDICLRIEGETRTNIKITDNSMDSDTTDFNFSGLTISQLSALQLETELYGLVTPETICVLAGSLPTGVETDFYSKLIPTLRTKGHVVILDTSGAALQSVITTQNFPHIMKPNIHELRAASGLPLTTDEEIITLACTWFTNGLELLVVSLGEEGALFITETSTAKVRPPKVTVASTVGAGDAMVAGIAYGLIQQLPLLELSRLATALSVAKITVAENGLTLSAHMQQLLPQVSIMSY